MKLTLPSWLTATGRRRNRLIPYRLQSRGFAAAETDRLLAAWTFDGGFTPSQISSSLGTIRARSREMAKNNPHMKRFLSLVVTNVVGEGFSFKSEPRDGEPGNWRIDTTASAVIEYHYNRWASYRDPATNQTLCDSTGRKTIDEIDRLNAKVWARDGEFFLYLDDHAQNPYGFAVRVLRPDSLDHNFNMAKTTNGTSIKCGIEYDEAGRPVAYHFNVKEHYNQETGSYARRRAIPAAKIVHGFTPEDESQPRGVPWAYASLVKLKMLDEYDRAELTISRDEACSVATYYAPKGDEDEIADLTEDDNSDTAKALIAEKEPGQSEILPIGWRREVNTPQHPNRQLTAFKASMLRDIAGGFLVEYSNFANDWGGVNFGSVRAGTISERDHWRLCQGDYIAQNKSPVFLAWLKSFLALQVSGALPPSKLDKFARHQYRGRRWMWIDPVKDVVSMEKAVAKGWKTNTQATADLGGSFEDNAVTIKREADLVAGEALEAVPVLNGAQIEAALEVLEKYATQAIGKEGAITLLTAAGVPNEAAQNMVNKQKTEKPND